MEYLESEEELKMSTIIQQKKEKLAKEKHILQIQQLKAQEEEEKRKNKALQ